MIWDAAAALIGQEELKLAPLTTNKIDKLHTDRIAFYKMEFGVPPSVFDNINMWKSAKERLESLQHLYEGSENMKEKHLTSVVNDFNAFAKTPRVSVALTSNRYKIMLNNMMTYGVVWNPHAYNRKIINSLGKGWGNIKSYL